MNKIIYENIIAFHPGYYVKELMEDLDMNQHELSKRLDTTAKTVSKLVNGEIKLSDEMARNLSLVFGTSVNMWLNLNKVFYEKKILIDKKIAENEQIELLKQLDYKFWVKLGFVNNTRVSVEKVAELLKFFKISNLEILKKRDFLVQFRTGICKIEDKNIINSNAWVQTAINIGREKEVPEYDENLLKNHLTELRSLTLLSEKDVFENLDRILSACGVTFVMLPTLKNCGINGAVKWINNDKVILAINDRKKKLDVFWFSLFHEIKHVLQKKKKRIIVSGNICEESDMEILENDADEFSREFLIPSKDYDKFILAGNFDESSIIMFANNINIHPGIVIGRLQHDKYLSFRSNLNSLKTSYEIKLNNY